MLQDETLTEKFIKKWFWIYFFAILTAPTWYVIRIIISNDLSVWDVWIIYSIISFITIISIYNDFWLTESLQYFLPRYHINKQHDYFKTAILLSLTFQTLTWIIIIFFLIIWSDWIATNYFHSNNATIILKLFCIYLLWVNTVQVISSVLNAMQDIFEERLITFIKMLSISLITFIFFIFWNWNIITYSIAWIIWLYIWLLVWIIIFINKYYYYIKKWKYNFYNNETKSYIKYALFTFLWINAWILHTQIDQQMIIYILWPESAWYYTNYLSLFWISTLIIWPIIAYLFPLISELNAKKQKIKIKLIQDFFYKYFSVFSISLWWLFFIFWPVISTVLLWEKFYYSWYYLKYSSFFIIFNIFISMNFSILWWIWKIKERMKIIVYSLIINILLNIMLINLIWIPWAIISTIIARIIMFYMTYKEINLNQKLFIDYNFILKNLLFVIIWIISIYILSKDLFILKDTYRYQNLIYLCIIWFTYYIYLWIVNYKELLLLKDEIIKLKR